MEKPKYYTLNAILQYNADYNVIYGERSNGKTTAVLDYALDDHVKSGYKNQLAIIRRWEEDYKGKNGQQMYESIVALGWIKEKTNLDELIDYPQLIISRLADSPAIRDLLADRVNATVEDIEDKNGGYKYIYDYDYKSIPSKYL